MVVVDEAEYRALPACDRRGPRLIVRWRWATSPARSQHARQALTLAAEDDVIRRTQATSLLGIAEYASGDLGAAERSLLAFQARMWQVGDVADALGITFILANIWLAQGRLRKAVSAYRQVLQLATQRSRAAHRHVGSVSRSQRTAHRTRRSRSAPRSTWRPRGRWVSRPH